MYKRQTSGLKDVDKHLQRKRFKSEDTSDVNCDDDDDNNDDDDDDEDDEDGEDGDKHNIKNHKDSSKPPNDFTSEHESETENKKPSVKKDRKGFALRYLENYGYEHGKGLGKAKNGIVEPVKASEQKGSHGLGYERTDIKKLKYDSTVEDELTKEEDNWLINMYHETVNTDCLESWVKCGPPLTTLSDDSPFCEPHLIRGIIDSKNFLDSFSVKEKFNGKKRSNPFESIQNAIFLNRAAMKMANMDAFLGWMFTEPKTKAGEPAVGPYELFYFADVCAGPGGFSEYVLYRKGWRAKGFGFTLKGENDFKLEQFIAGPPETFEPHYGKLEDGDIFVPENIISFRDHVMKYTDNRGVHLMMADGGIHIETNLCEQEIITKKLYICQCIVALLIVRTGGNFVVKLFDLFTEFSVGLVYLMYRSFEEILILKPRTSRPANSERYLICKWKRKDCDMIARHLFEINKKIPKFGESHKQDVLQLVPTEVLEADEEFFQYIKTSNMKLAEMQIKNLEKMGYYSDNTDQVDTRQQTLRKECLKEWNIPDKARAEPKNPDPHNKWTELVGSSSPCDYWSKISKITSKNSLPERVKIAKHSWKLVVLSQEESKSTCGFYLGLGKNNIYRYVGGKWVKQNSIGLCLCLPANTIVHGEIVQEFSGTGRSQIKISAFHIIDGLFLGGENIRHQPFEKRREMCALFAKALFKEECPIRIKNSYGLGGIQKLWDHLVLRKTKSSRVTCPAIPLGEDSFYKAVGVMLMKDLTDQYDRFWSNSRKKFYLYCPKEESVFEDQIKENYYKYYADFENCFQSRLFWWWEGVSVHEEQNFESDPSKMTRYDLMSLLSSK